MRPLNEEEFKLFRKSIVSSLYKEYPESSRRRRIIELLLKEEREVSLEAIHDEIYPSRAFGYESAASILRLLDFIRVRFNEYFCGDGKKHAYQVQLTSDSPYSLVGATNPAFYTRQRVFLCHSSADKQFIRQLHIDLKENGFNPWLDEVDLMPGQDWDAEIKKTVRKSDIVLVCLSTSSTTREGYVNKELKFALDVADEKPEGTTYIIPARIENCALPSRLAKWQSVDLFKPNGFEKLCEAIRSKSGTSS